MTEKKVIYMKKKNTRHFNLNRMAALLLVLIMCISSGCGSEPEAGVARVVRELPKNIEETTQEEDVQEEAYQEDVTEYGNTVGNQYNDGVFLTDSERGEMYFFNSYENAFCKTNLETGDTKMLSDNLMVYLQLKDKTLYGVQTDIKSGDSKLISLEPESGETKTLRDAPPQYLQLADGVFYFTDYEENNLRKLPIEGGGEEVLLDEIVYYPVVYKDWIFFQMDSDNESLYRMPKVGGEPEKLNDVQSYCPQAYKDRIYYEAKEDGVNTLRSMKLDGSDNQILLEAVTYTPNLYDGKLYFVEDGNKNVISYLDLESGSNEKLTIDLKENIRKAVKKTYGELENYEIDGYSNLNFSGGYMLFIAYEKIEGEECQDLFIYDMEKDDIIIIPDFCRTGEEAKGTEEPEKPEEPEEPEEPVQEAPAVSSKDAEARAVAQSIADSIPPGTDLERVQAAASAVAGYCSRGVYTTDDPDYKTAYGVFCKGVYTCAGATRALGMVLDCMGYSWAHVNPNMWTHQWCQVVMDGQVGYADGQGGIAGYGKHPMQTD